MSELVRVTTRSARLGRQSANADVAEQPGSRYKRQAQIGNMSKLVCPTDRQLALRAKLNTGWSLHTDKPANRSELSAEEKQEIINVVRRAETIEQLQNLKMQQHLDRISNMTKFAVGDGVKQCYICLASFGLFAASRRVCSYCKKATCDKCSVHTDSSVYKYLLLCRICSEKRELWKRSGTWLFKEVPPELNVPSQNTMSVPSSPGPNSFRVKNPRFNFESRGGAATSSLRKSSGRGSLKAQAVTESSSASCTELARRIGNLTIGENGRLLDNLNNQRTARNSSHSPSPRTRKSQSDHASPAPVDSTSTSPAAHSVSSNKDQLNNKNCKAAPDNKFNYSLQSVIAYLKSHQREGRASPLASTSHDEDACSTDEQVAYELVAEGVASRSNRAASIVPQAAESAALASNARYNLTAKQAIPKWASVRVRSNTIGTRDSPKLSVTDDSSCASSRSPSESDGNAMASSNLAEIITEPDMELRGFALNARPRSGSGRNLRARTNETIQSHPLRDSAQ